MPRNPIDRAGARLIAGILFVAAVVGILYKTTIAIGIGPGWDTFAFLANAAEFAGKGYGYAELHRPPFISWLVSVLFRAGAPMHEAVIQWVDAALSLIGLGAFYLLLRRRFTRALSAAGMLLLLAVPPLWLYLGTGYTDMASVSLSMLMLWALVKATEDNPLFYLLAGPLYTLAVLTRYNSLLIAFPAVVWLLMRWKPFRHAKYIGGAALLALAAYIPAGRFYAERFEDVLFPFVLAFGVSETVSTPTEEAIEAAGPWYVANMPNLIMSEPLTYLALLLILAAGLGLLWGAVSRLQDVEGKGARLFTAALFIAPAIAAQVLGMGMVVRQVTIPIAVFGAWRALAPIEKNEDDSIRVTAGATLDAMMLTWLLSSFDFHGHFTIQVPRYVITMAPAFIYLMIRGLELGTTAILHALDAGSDEDHSLRGNMARRGFAAALAVVALLSVGAAALSTSTEPDRLVAAARDSAEWMRASDPDLDKKTVQSDLWPLTSWYAKTKATSMPFFEDDRAFAHELDKRLTDYYVTIKSRRYDAYDEVLVAGPAVVLERDSAQREDLPEVLYLGASWENYVEQVTDFEFYLMHDNGRYGWEGTAFMDAMTAEELGAYDAVALYGVRWRDRYAGEEELRQYVENGGSLIIDASSNLGELPYELGDTVMFDTVIRRGQTATDAQLRVIGGDSIASQTGTDDLEAGPFVDENGGGWFGATYKALPEAEPLDVRAALGPEAVVAIREVGDGHVYWIGQNLVWHAFLHENDDEAALIRAVFADAIERAE